MDPWVLLSVAFMLFSLSVLAPVVFWAVRTKQFSDLDRARYLALGPEAVARRERELRAAGPAEPGEEEPSVSA